MVEFSGERSISQSDLSKCCIQQSLQLIHRFPELFRAAEVAGDLDDVAVTGQRWDPQNVRHDELRGPKFGVFLQQLIQYLPCLRAIPVEKVFTVLLQPFRPRVPDALSIGDDSYLTPFSMDEEVSSLSAILLVEDYYEFIHAGKQETDGLPVLGLTYLIPLKATAWLDLMKRREAGEAIDEKGIKTHKNDVSRLYQIIDPEQSISLPGSIEEDLRQIFR